MAKKEERQERRRFKVPEGGKRENWTEEQRKEFLEKADKLRPYVEHLITPAPAPAKKKDLLPIVDD